MKKHQHHSPRTRLAKDERARMVALDAALKEYSLARGQHQASYPHDLAAARQAAADLCRILAALAELAPTGREYRGLPEHWDATRSRHAARLQRGAPPPDAADQP